MKWIQPARLVAFCVCLVVASGARPDDIRRVPGGSAIAATSTVDWVLHTQATLDRPVSMVWPAFRDMKSWYTEYAFEVLSGPPYQAGPGLAEQQIMKVT